MSEAKLRDRKARMANILEVASTLLHEEGLEKLTVHRLAKALSWTPGALYRYFSSKDEILTTLQVQILEEIQVLLAKVLREAAAQENFQKFSPGLQSIVSVCLTTWLYTTLPTVMPQRFRLLARIVGDPQPLVKDSLVEPVIKAARQTMAGTVRFLMSAEEHDALEPGDAQQRALMLWAAVHGATCMAKFGRFDDDNLWSSQVQTNLIQSLLFGWGAFEEDVREAMAFVEAYHKSQFVSAEEFIL